MTSCIARAPWRILLPLRRRAVTASLQQPVIRHSGRTGYWLQWAWPQSIPQGQPSPQMLGNPAVFTAEEEAGTEVLAGGLAEGLARALKPAALTRRPFASSWEVDCPQPHCKYRDLVIDMSCQGYRPPSLMR